jgi:hypothetical protein
MLKKITALMLCYAILGCAEQSTNENDSQKVMADITVVDMDVLNIGAKTPAKLFDGNVLMTIVGGNIVYKKE